MVTDNVTTLYVVTKLVTMVTANVTSLCVITKHITMVTAGYHGNSHDVCGYQACYHGNS